MGAILLINGRPFHLLEADEYTYAFMENNKHLFIMADWEAISKMLKSQVGLWDWLVVRGSILMRC